MEEESVMFRAYLKTKATFNVRHKFRVLTTPRMQYTDHQENSFKSPALVKAINETPDTAELVEKGVWLPKFNIKNHRNNTGKFDEDQKVLVKFESQHEVETAIRSGFTWLYKQASKGPNFKRKQELVAKQAADTCLRATFKTGKLKARIEELEAELAQANRTITQRNTTITGLRGMYFEFPVVYSVLKLPIRRSC